MDDFKMPSALKDVPNYATGDTKLMPDAFDAWADDYIRRQYPFYNPETRASIGAPLKAHLEDAWNAGKADTRTSDADLPPLSRNMKSRAEAYGIDGEKLAEAWPAIIAARPLAYQGDADKAVISGDCPEWWYALMRIKECFTDDEEEWKDFGIVEAALSTQIPNTPASNGVDEGEGYYSLSRAIKRCEERGAQNWMNVDSIMILDAARAYAGQQSAVDDKDRERGLADFDRLVAGTFVASPNSPRIQAIRAALGAPSEGGDVLRELEQIIPATPLPDGMRRDLVADVKRLLARKQSPAFDEKVVRGMFMDIEQHKDALTGCYDADDPAVARDLGWNAAITCVLAELSKGTQGKDSLDGKTFRIEHDGFEGEVIGRYRTREGKEGVVLQQTGTRVVHVYGKKWLNIDAAQKGEE